MDKRKIIYYEDELNDEFSVAVINPRRIDADYKYIHTSPFKKFTHFFWYRIVATPLAFLYTKLKFGHRCVGREKLKAERGGYFIYGNHTQDIADALIPSMLSFPKDAYLIVHPNNVSIRVIGKITPSLGALPLPDDLKAYKSFISAVEKRYREGNAVFIYPEAHIWPYYTGIRPFRDDSFHYPVRYGAPVFCFTNTYHKRKHRREPRIVTYIDGPFYPDKTLPPKEARKALRDEIYATMKKRAELSDISVIEYRRKDEKNG